MYYGAGTDVDSHKENMPDSSSPSSAVQGGTNEDDGQKNQNNSKRTKVSVHCKGGIKRTHKEMDSQKGIWGEDGIERMDGDQGILHQQCMRMDINSSNDDYIGDRNVDEFDPFFNQRITRGCEFLTDFPRKYFSLNKNCEYLLSRSHSCSRLRLRSRSPRSRSPRSRSCSRSRSPHSHSPCSRSCSPRSRSPCLHSSLSLVLSSLALSLALALLARSRSLTRARSLTRSLALARLHSLARTRSLALARSHSLARTCSPCSHSLALARSHSLAHLLARSHSLAHLLARSLSLAHLLSLLARLLLLAHSLALAQSLSSGSLARSPRSLSCSLALLARSLSSLTLSLAHSPC